MEENHNIHYLRNSHPNRQTFTYKIMEYTNIVYYAQQLKTLLMSHDQAVTQLNLIECKMEQLDRHLFAADINGNHSYRLHLRTKKSTAVGICKMYKLYKEKKWNQIQELSTLIMKSASSSPSRSSNLEMSPRTRQLDLDTTVQSLTEDFCCLSRDS